MPTARSPTASLIGNDVARGGDLFRLNCASCHNFTGRGGALSSGKYAPGLDPATPAQIYTAMLTGPQNMPKFSDRQLVPEEKRDIIAYVRSSSQTIEPGRLRPRRFRAGAPRAWLSSSSEWWPSIGVAMWIGART